MVGLAEYYASSMGSIFSNPDSIFLPILLALIATELRQTKWLKWEIYFDDLYAKIGMMILSYAFVIPIALIFLSLVIGALWLFSFGVG